MSDVRLDDLLTKLAVWAVLFPYINPFPVLRTDTQPWAMLLSTIVVFFAWRQLRVNSLHLAIFSLFACAALLLILDISDLSATRTAAGYLSLFVVSLAIAHAARVNQPAMIKAIDISLIIWVVVGLIQRFVARSAFDWLVSDARTTASRGVIGLAPEPTYYASCILLILLWRSLFDIRPWHVVLGLIAIFVLASSSQVALLLFIALGVFVATSLIRPRYFHVAVGTVTVAAVIVLTFVFVFPETRLGTLVNLAAQRPELILLDASINERALQIFASVASVYNRGFMPSGFDGEAWLDYVNSVRISYPTIFRIPQYSDRIMSGLGSLVYQLGFVSLVFFVAFFVSSVRWRADWQFKIIWLSLFLLTMLTAIPLGQPMLGAILGAFAYKSARA